VSFSCPHFRPEDEYCLRLKTDCVPGRRACVLEGKAVFAVPAEERVRLLEEEKRAKSGLPDLKAPAKCR
jgi:hypothetical protein